MNLDVQFALGNKIEELGGVMLILLTSVNIVE
jgi:hypothetical protein